MPHYTEVVPLSHAAGWDLVTAEMVEGEAVVVQSESQSR